MVGDRVMWEEAPGTGGKLVSVLERESELRRRDNQGKDRVLAANLQGVVVVMSPQRPAFNANLMDRYLVAIAQSTSSSGWFEQISATNVSEEEPSSGDEA